MAPRRYWVETLGCPKNSVDSDKVTGRLLAEMMTDATPFCDPAPFAAERFLR